MQNAAKVVHFGGMYCGNADVKICHQADCKENELKLQQFKETMEGQEVRNK